MNKLIPAVALCAFAGSAFAQVAQDEPMPPIVVEHINGARIVADCTPPNASARCEYYHRLIRENFTPHEIELLFGPATAYMDYRTNYSFAQEHYAAFLRDIEENGLPVPVVANVRYEDDYYRR